MKRKVIVALSIILTISIGFIILLLYFLLPSPDRAISTPSQVRQIVLEEIPNEYQVESITSIQRISEFEDEHRPMKWVVLTLKNKTITDENELYKIAKPICLGLLSKNTGYEGIDISPSTILPYGANCSIWGA